MVSIALKRHPARGGRARKRGLVPAPRPPWTTQVERAEGTTCARRSKIRGSCRASGNCNSARFQRASRQAAVAGSAGPRRRQNRDLSTSSGGSKGGRAGIAPNCGVGARANQTLRNRSSERQLQLRSEPHARASLRRALARHREPRDCLCVGACECADLLPALQVTAHAFALGGALLVARLFFGLLFSPTSALSCMRLRELHLRSAMVLGPPLGLPWPSTLAIGWAAQCFGPALPKFVRPAAQDLILLDACRRRTIPNRSCARSRRASPLRDAGNAKVATSSRAAGSEVRRIVQAMQGLHNMLRIFGRCQVASQ